jgi:large subunit ribosomal protein L4
MASRANVELDPAIFGIEPNVGVMHQVVTAQLAAARSGTQSTKTRAEVRGGGKKPWRQKGTGRARQGSTRAPHWTGGGVALGPKPRSYKQKTPKKMVQLALRSALSDRHADGKVVVIDAYDRDAPKTKNAIALLEQLNISGKVLVVVTHEDFNASLSFRNLPDCHVILSSELNAYDVLCSDWVLFSRGSLPTAPKAETESEPASAAAEPVVAAEEASV